MEPENELLSGGMSIQEYLLILKRRRAIILQAFVLIAVVGIVVTLMTKPVYQSSAKLLISAPSLNMNSVDSNNPLSSLLMLYQPPSVATQIEVLQTPDVMNKVLSQTGPAILKIAQIPDTDIIEVDAEAQDPKVAAAAPNALLDLYIKQDADTGVEGLASAHQFVADQLSQARQRLANTEAALKAFKLKNHVSDFLQNRAEQAGRLANLTSRQQSLQMEMAGLQAQMAQERRLLALQPSLLFVQLKATNALSSSLRDQIAQLNVERAGMTQPGGYTARAPQIRAVDARIAALQGRLAQQPLLSTTTSSTPNAIRESLKGKMVDQQIQVAAIRAQQLDDQTNLQAAKAAIDHFADGEYTFASLNRDHDQAVASERSFSAQLADLTLREKVRHPTARIIVQALVPTSPVRPKKLQGVLFSCLIGLFAGLCLALLQEFMDDRINTVEDADRTLELPNLGRVPALTATDARLLPQMQGMDPAAEAYRVLRTNIHFASVDTPAKTLVVTSSRSGEGKSTTAANLAFAMALDGRRVILVDSDMRRPSLHKMLDLPTQPGLTDILLGEATIDDVLMEHEDMPGLWAMSCGSTPPNPSELLGSRRFRTIVNDLREQSDIVIFDSPPVLAAADSQILASQMDGVVIVIEAGETRKAEARQTVSILRHAHAKILGIVYNKVSVMGNAGYYNYQIAPRIEAADVLNGSSAFRPFGPRLVAMNAPTEPNDRGWDSCASRSSSPGAEGNVVEVPAKSFYHSSNYPSSNGASPEAKTEEQS